MKANNLFDNSILSSYQNAGQYSTDLTEFSGASDQIAAIEKMGEEEKYSLSGD